MKHPFVVAGPMPTSLDNFAQVLARHGLLRLHMSAARHRAAWSPELQRWNAAIAFAQAANERWTATSTRRLENRYALMPWFDRWVTRQVRPGDWVLSSFGYVLKAFRKARAGGGKTLIEAGNSHPEQYWQIMKEEYGRWGWAGDPIPRFHHERTMEMLIHTDYVFCPSTYVRDSYRRRGFPEDRLLTAAYPVLLDLFHPAPVLPPNRPFRVLSIADLCLRKGTPYLLEACDLLRKQGREIELVLFRRISDDVRKIIENYRGPVTWFDHVPRGQLPDILRSCHVHVLPSLEEGLVRSGLEAMASGLPVIATAHTGLADFIEHGRNGYLVPIRDSTAIANAIGELMDQPEAALEMGRAARRAMERVHPDAFEQQVMNALSGLNAA